jgi:UDP-N-acetylmuramyl pentapeptide phosphotransferase/UDP-N-acetylglucosamine-1-phosphate transferase
VAGDSVNTSLIAFAVGLIASMGLTVPVRQLALRTGMVDHPGPRKVHVQPMPLLGGLAIYLGVLIALLVSMDGPALTQVIGIYLGATLVAVVGILDDRGLLHHQIKLFGAMPLAAVILLLSGIRAQVFSNIIPGAPGIWADTILTIVWVVGITASFSILDHMDGLCAGVAAMASLFFAIFALDWSAAGKHHGGCRSGRSGRVPALEFQARENFHGRWRRNVPWLPDGHAGAEAAPRVDGGSPRGLADSGLYSGRHNL